LEKLIYHYVTKSQLRREMFWEVGFIVVDRLLLLVSYRCNKGGNVPGADPLNQKRGWATS
jgi:hypothetical protein